MTDMTALEFIEKHKTDDACPESVGQHLDRLILAAVAEDRNLWSFGAAEDGSPKAEMVRMPEALWDALLDKAIRIAAGAELEQFIRDLQAAVAEEEGR